MPDQDQRVRVALRVRPVLKYEKLEAISTRKLDDTTLTMVSDELVTSVQTTPAVNFRFDYVFDDTDDQATVYEESCQEMVDLALTGYNATIFAYGQTGSGKTHTILGEIRGGRGGGAAVRSNASTPSAQSLMPTPVASPAGGIAEEDVLCAQTGMFLRVFHDVFSYAEATQARQHLVITLSAVEIYVDEVMDLLNDKAKVKIRDSGNDAFITGVRNAEVLDLADVVCYFQIANSFRSVTATKMNDQSSRSHGIFFIDVFRIPKTDQMPTRPRAQDILTPEGAMRSVPGMEHSRISLVDLAGSERVKRSGVEGQGMVEAAAINKSLSTLGTVINSLYEQSTHVPYRDSKLTKLLRPAFTDVNSRILLIGQVSPAAVNFVESLGTSKFCDRVKGLKAGAVSEFVDPEVQEAYLQSLRVNAALAADIRIAGAQHHHEAQRPTVVAQRSGITVAQARANAEQHLVRTKDQRAAEREAELQAELQAVRQELLDTVVVTHREQHAIAAGDLFTLSDEVDAVQAELAALAGQHEVTSADRLLEAKRVKKARVTAQSKADSLRKDIDDAALALEQVLVAATEAEQGRLQQAAAQGQEDDEEWRSFEEDWDVAQLNHGIVETFYTLWDRLAQYHEAFILTVERTRSETDGVPLESVSEARQQEARQLRQHLIPDFVEFLVERAVDISLGSITYQDSYSWVDIQGLSSRPREAQFWDPPFDLTLTLPPPMVGDPPPHDVTTFSDDEDDMAAQDAATPDAPQTITHEQAAREAREKRKKLKKGDAARAKIESEEANRNYLMTVYDSPNLVHELTRFLQAGTLMLKHGRSGSPHMKKVLISATGGVREVVWSDPDAPVDGRRSSMAIANISAVSLGATTKVFKRYAKTPLENDFYLSVTFHLRDKSRTLDVVASSLVDFEAWVLGMCHIVQVDPYWNKPFRIGKELDAAVGQRLEIDDAESEICQRHCLPFETYAALREKLMEHHDEIHMQMRLFNNDAAQVFESMGGIHAPQINDDGAVLMTKGELRFLATPWNIDIVRVCALWEFFRDRNLVFDANYTPATRFGRTSR